MSLPDAGERPPPPVGDPPADITTTRSPRMPLSTVLGRYSALLLWAAFIVIFGVLSSDVFLSGITFRITFREGVVTAIVALAFLVPLVAGVFDLSVGAMMGFALVVLNWFNSYHPDVPVALVAVGCVVAGAAIGLLSGLIVVRFRVNSLIATLGMSQVLAAVQLKISDNRQMTGAFPKGFQEIGAADVLGIPVVLLYLLVLSVGLWFVLEHTPVGRSLAAVGGNADAARLAGIPVNRVTYGSLAASGAIAALAGVVFATMVGVYNASTGPGLLFPALAAVFLGASQFSGRPNVWGTLVAYFALAFGVKGLEIVLGPGTFWIKPLFQGVSLLIAVALASRMVGQVRRQRRARARQEGTVT